MGTELTTKAKAVLNGMEKRGYMEEDPVIEAEVAALMAGNVVSLPSTSASRSSYLLLVALWSKHTLAVPKRRHGGFPGRCGEQGDKSSRHFEATPTRIAELRSTDVRRILRSVTERLLAQNGITVTVVSR